MNYKELSKYDGNWTEDYNQENGKYINKCRMCNSYFLGNKYRFICKACVKEVEESTSNTETT